MKQTSENTDRIVQRMKDIDAPPLVVESFLKDYRKLIQGHRGMLDKSMIRPLEECVDAQNLAEFKAAGERALDKTLMIKLNGGLGTSMGLDRAKSLLPVKDDLTFLDILARQVLRFRQAGHPVPLLLMNSFATHEDTLQVLQRYPELEEGQRGIPTTFLQHRVPKIRQDNLLPVEWPADPAREWCPPGHGNLYLALVTSGLLDKLIERGFHYVFTSNIDNLGATINLPILGYLAERQIPFIMEVTERTDADRKGGHVARLRDGRLVLREKAQCPEEEEQDFQDIRKYSFFNTNNLWIDLRALKNKLMEQKFLLDLPLIINSKNVDPKDPASPAVYQLETAMGAAISLFESAEVVQVPRLRFAPVKTTADLLSLWSDAYTVTPDMQVILNPVRAGSPVIINLDTRYYGTCDDLKLRFPHGAPSLIACDSLELEGDFRFGRSVALRGRVRLSNPDPTPKMIPDKAELIGARASSESTQSVSQIPKIVP